MLFHLYGKVAFEDWDHRSCETGIGGSETSQIQMAKGLAKVGHEVHSYAPIPDDCPREWEGTHWHKTEEFDFNSRGCIVIYRSPEMIDQFDMSIKDRCFWLVCQDWDYPTLTPERLAKFDRIVVLCYSHLNYMLQKNPQLQGKLWVTRNCATTEKWQTVVNEEMPLRDPYRMMYASSPDRGLKAALQVYQRVKEYIPQATFVATYGYNNMDKLIKQGLSSGVLETVKRAEAFQRDKDECMALIEKTGAKFTGRITQTQLYREWAKTTALIYITDFFETGYITGWEAQCMGAIPVFSPIYAQGEHIKYGIDVPGNPKSMDTIVRAAAEVVRLMKDPDLQRSIRGPMMEYARNYWCWEQVVDKKPGENWVDAATEDLEKRQKQEVSYANQFRLLGDQVDDDNEVATRAKWLRVDHTDTFWDIGASTGAWSVAAALNGAKVVAIDHTADMTGIADQIDKNGVNDQVVVVPVKVHAYSGGKTIVSTANSSVEYPVLSLDALWLDLQHKKMSESPTVVRINQLGDELNVLRGGAGVLSWYTPRLLIRVIDNKSIGVDIERVKAFVTNICEDYQFDAKQFFDKSGKVFNYLYCWVV